MLGDRRRLPSPRSSSQLHGKAGRAAAASGAKREPQGAFRARPSTREGGLPRLGQALGLACLLLAGSAQAAPQVVATIKPLHSLVAGVTDGITEPELLLAAGDSPHTYAMRPSEARAVREADLIVRISPHMETFLSAALEAHSHPEHVLTAAQAEGVRVLEASPQAAREEHPSANSEAGHQHAADELRKDYHIWLDPQNAQAITRAVAERLAEIDPSHAEAYRANAADVTDRLRALDERLEEDLAPIQDIPYVVFHDAYQHFERRYGLEAAGAVTVNPEQPPGARHLQELRERIRQLDAACVFSEPQFEPAIVESLVRGLEVRNGQLDPLGAELEPGPDAYFELLEGLAEGFRSCLMPAMEASPG